MPVIVKLPSGNWRAQVSCQGKYISKTFRRRAVAETSAVLERLKLTLGNHKLREITRSTLIDYGKKRACYRPDRPVLRDECELHIASLAT
jgi:hypothetical protein